MAKRNSDNLPENSHEWLNYHHLLYFWVVAKAGSIAQASERLNLAQPTISMQLKLLEKSLGHPLFMRLGRNLELTEMGQQVFRYAKEIFTLGQEMLDVLKGEPNGRPVRLIVGIPDHLPKLVALRMIRPAFEQNPGMQSICREGKLPDLLSELAVHRLDVVLSDTPQKGAFHQGFCDHPLGTCGVTMFGTRDLAEQYRRGFPYSLRDAPLLVPAQGSQFRSNVDRWLEDNGIVPRIVGEFDDTALMKEFGSAGIGLFPSPSAVEKEIQQQFGVSIVGSLTGLHEHYFAITLEHRLKHPAIVSICSAAREDWLAPRTVPATKNGPPEPVLAR